jgi:hypothetical protein
MASPPHRRGGAGVWWGVLGGAGLVVLAVAVLSLTGVITWGFSVTAGTAGAPAAGSHTSGPAVDARPVDMPDRAGSYVTLQEATSAVGNSTRPTALQDYATSVERLTAEAVGRSYGGAPVGVRSYATDDLLNTATAVAVRAPSPLLEVVPAQDADLLGLGAPIREIVTEGDVRCLVNNGTVTVGNKPDPANIHVEQCQRTGPTLTVLVYPSGELTSAQVAAATDDIWRSVSG